MRRLEELEDEVRSWTANDGGLTWAASDALAVAEYVRKSLTGERSVSKEEAWECMVAAPTGTEQEMWELLLE